MNEHNQPHGDFEQALIARMVDARLKARARDAATAPVAHPDADVITALVEARLDEADSCSLISHLVNCAACLHITAELIRAEPEMDEVSSAVMPIEEPSRLKRLLDRLAAELIPSAGEEAVFAYEEKREAEVSEDRELEEGKQPK